jgi:hypothetical protein
MDHPLPKYKEPKIHSGTDTRDDYTHWNVSNEVSRKSIKENLTKTYCVEEILEPCRHFKTQKSKKRSF